MLGVPNKSRTPSRWRGVFGFLAKRVFLLNFNIAQDKILQTIDKRRGKCYNYRVRRARRDIIVLWI
jgi:hypothetical protein